MKKKIIVVLLALVAAFSLGLVGCSKDNAATKTFVVTFDTGTGGSAVPSQTVQNGKKATKPADPTNAAGDSFVEWQLNGTAWRFETDIVTKDITLTAKWRAFSTEPTEVAMEDVPFSSNLTWYQGNLADSTTKVYYKTPEAEGFTELAGTRTVTAQASGMDRVTFTPTTIPQGGYYSVKIVTAGETEAEYAVPENLLFKGAGTKTNPYMVSTNTEFNKIIRDEAYASKCYAQVKNLQHVDILDPIFIDEEAKLTFSGTYDGKGYTVSFTGDGGLFHKLAAGATVKDLTVSGSVTASETNLYAVGGLTDENGGTIDNVIAKVSVVDGKGSGALVANAPIPDKDAISAGGGGVAGVNKKDGVIRNSTHSGSGSVKAAVGGGGIAAYNFGLIEKCNSTATLPAGNQANSAKSSNDYSFTGGMAGFNYGAIRKCAVTGRVFAQSAYAAVGDGNEGKQQGFGGIAAYNGAGAVIEECSFVRAATAKEFIPKDKATELGDSSNNLGVASIHGDMYVGGIAGINDGSIAYSYVNCAIIAGRDYVGGIAGKNEGTVANSYAVAEVVTKDDKGLPTSAGAKTTATTYRIAPGGGTDCVYLPLAKTDGSVWVSGTATAPVVPALSAAQIGTLNTGAAKFADDGLLLWQKGIVTGVSLPAAKTIKFLETATLTAEVYPANAPDQTVGWSSSNPEIVSVDAEGNIKGLQVGAATITATTHDGGFTAECVVTVEDYNQVTSILVTCDELTLPEVNNSKDRLKVNQGTVFTLKVTVNPEDADYPGYTFESSNSRATVTKDGVVTVVTNADNAGSFSIKIIPEDPGFAVQEFRFSSVAV